MNKLSTLISRRTLVAFASATVFSPDLQSQSAIPRSPVIAKPGVSRGPGGVETHREHIQVMVRTSDTGGRFCILSFDAPPLGPDVAGPPLHVHADVDEWLYVEKGNLLVEVGGKRYRVAEGGAILAPMGLPHRYLNCASVPGRIVVNYSPGGRMDEFFEIDKAPAGVRMSQRQLSTIYSQFHMKLLGPPLRLTDVQAG